MIVENFPFDKIQNWNKHSTDYTPGNGEEKIDLTIRAGEGQLPIIPDTIVTVEQSAADPFWGGAEDAANQYLEQIVCFIGIEIVEYA